MSPTQSPKKSLKQPPAKPEPIKIQQVSLTTYLVDILGVSSANRKLPEYANYEANYRPKRLFSGYQLPLGAQAQAVR